MENQPGDEQRHLIIINDTRMSWRVIGFVVRAVMMVCLPIGLGVIVGSSAMQWVGFLFGISILFANLVKLKHERTFDDIDAARDYLDGLR